jgi:hypothetical protein
VVAALLALILGGGAGFFAQRYYEPRRIVDVAGGHFTARVPKDLAGFVVDGDWRPPGSSEALSAFRVSKEDSWGAPGTSTPGLFVGVIPTPDNPAKNLVSGQQFGCSSDGDPTPQSVDNYEVLDKISTGCPGGNMLLQRVATFPAGYSLLIQVQVPEGVSALDIANSISYAGDGTS